MVDHISEEKRSWNMSKIRSKNTKPEMIVRKMLHKKGIRYRLHVKDLPGKPDLSNKKKNFSVFINGCFWHQHLGCKQASLPKSNRGYWIPKLQKNVDRQKENISELVKNSWNVFIVWECETKSDDTIKQLVKKIKSI